MNHLLKTNGSGRLRWLKLGALTLVTASLEAEPLTGGSFVLVGAPATGGTSQGGGYALTGYVATAGATTSSGGNFDLTCGLIGTYLASGGSVALQVELTPDGLVRVWWPTEATGYQLEFTTALGQEAVWQVVDPMPVGHSFTTGPTQTTRFYRLRRP